MSNNVVTRFAPSPTGLLHAGNYRTGVFAYLFAKQQGGKFIVRIEDTDKERSKKEYEEDILEMLHWLNLQYDVLYRQSENNKRHEELINKLIAEDKAYVSKEEPKEEGQRGEVIRFRNPNQDVTFTDIIRGPITFNTKELGDFVIARTPKEPVFHFAVVADDADEGVTHVIRGDDHISNTPRQILIGQALGFPIPIYAHLPLVLGPDRAKLSKRRGAKGLRAYREMGILPEAMINYLTLLGWHPEGEKEVFSFDELIEVFSLPRIQKSSGIFDETKLMWFNREHIKKLSDFAFAERLEEFMKMMGEEMPSYAASVMHLVKDRSETLLQAMDALTEGEFDFIKPGFETPSPTLLVQGAKATAEAVIGHFKRLEELLGALPEGEFDAEKVKAAVFPYATEVGRAGVLWPMRIALSGKEKSPDPFTLAGLLGKEETLKRLSAALLVL